MPDDDLILNVRQIDGYPTAGNAIASDAILLQRGGLGGPYLSISPVAFVSTALATPGAGMAIGGQLSALSVQAGSGQFSNASVNVLYAQKAGVVDLEATWGSLGTLNADVASFVQAQCESLGVGGDMQVSGDMQVGGTANMASAVVQTNLTVGGGCAFGYLTVNQTLDAANLNVANLADVCNLIVNGNFAVPNGTATVGGYPIVTLGNIALSGLAPLDSPAFTGNPTAPTPATSPTDNSTSIATTAFVVAVVDSLATQISVAYAPLASPAFSGLPTAPTAAPGNTTGQLATTAFVMNAVAASVTGVSSFNTRTGAIVLDTTDVIDAGGAPLVSPAFTGSPIAPTAAPGTNTTQLATTAFVTAAVAASTAGVTSFNGRTGAIIMGLADVTGAGGAPLAGPIFQGVPQAPTATVGTDTAQLATCAFVQATVTAVDSGVVSFNGRSGAVSLTANDISAAGGAPLGSPALYGTPTAPTAPPGTANTQLATCAYVVAAIAAMSGVASFNTRTGVITLTAADLTGAGGALLASPTFTGTPAGPTATAGTSSTQLATTAFVTAALAAFLPLAGGTLTGNLGITRTGANDASLTLTRAAGNSAAIYSRTGANTRWMIQLGNNAAETGSNAGSDFGIVPYTDAGVATAAALYISRATGAATFTGTISTPGIIYPAWASNSLAFALQAGSGSLGFVVGGGMWGQIALGPLQSGTVFPVLQWYLNSATSTMVASVPGSSFNWQVTPSDRRLKSNIKSATIDALALINRLPVHELDLTLPLSGVSRHWNCALIADEVREVIPIAYIPPPDQPATMRGRQSPGYASLGDLALICTLVKAVQQLTARLTQLEERMAT
jgi:hypothetical protein